MELLIALFELFFGINNGLGIPVVLGILPVVLALGAAGASAAAGIGAATALGVAGTALAAGGLGLAVGSHIDNKRMLKKQRKEQKALQAQAQQKADAEQADARNVSRWHLARSSGMGIEEEGPIGRGTISSRG